MKLCRDCSWSEFGSALVRRKIVNLGEDDENGSKLAKVLTTLDLTALGIGSTLGVGVYVLAGDVAKNTAGPAVTISFFIAAIASIFAGLCYAEFGARVPKAGSAYIYSYVCIGELFAFVIGWNLILEYLIGSASVVKAIFLYLDELGDNAMSHFFVKNLPLCGNELGPYADIFSLGLTLVFTVAIAFGARQSSIVNNIFTFINLIVVSTVIIAGMWHVNASNWTIPQEQVPKGYGTGGFVPYGIHGVIKGAARCFFAFIGFDCIATAGEEAKNPQTSIPISIVVSLSVVFCAYFGISTILTMIIPYYAQNSHAPLPHVFQVVDWVELEHVITIGAICGLFASLLGAMFPLPRIIYAMASDGLLFKPLAKVHPKFHTPFMGTVIAGIITGVLALVIELNHLINMMSIGTLLAYSMVAACVLILRYDESYGVHTEKSKNGGIITARDYFDQMFMRNNQIPTRLSSSLVSWLTFTYFCIAFIFSGLIAGFESDLGRAEPLLLSILVILFVILMGILLIVSFQPVSTVKLTFSVPLVPWIPGISILINVYLMTTLPSNTWEKYAYWMIIGLAIYLCYGIWFSKTDRNYPIGYRNDFTTTR